MLAYIIAFVVLGWSETGGEDSATKKIAFSAV